MARTLDPSIMRGLRVAATLVAVAPVRVRLGDGHRILLEVRRPPLPDSSDHPVVSPCWFRALVVQTPHGPAAGAGTIMDSLTDAETLTVDVALVHAGMTLPGGIWRIDHPGSWTYLFAATLGIEGAHRAVVDGEPGLPVALSGSLGGPIDVRYLEDECTGVTVIRMSGPAGDERSARCQLEVVHDVLARCAGAELSSELQQPPTGGGGVQR